MTPRLWRNLPVPGVWQRFRTSRAGGVCVSLCVCRRVCVGVCVSACVCVGGVPPTPHVLPSDQSWFGVNTREECPRDSGLVHVGDKSKRANTNGRGQQDDGEEQFEGFIQLAQNINVYNYLKSYNNNNNNNNTFNLYKVLF